MSDKRKILISAQTKDEFEKIESLLESFSIDFINSFQEVKLSILSSHLQFKTDNGSQESIFIPEGAMDLIVKFGECESGISDSKAYTINMSFVINIDGKNQYITTEIRSFYKINQIKSLKILKK